MTILLVLLLFAVPGAAFWSLMRGLDPVGRLVVSVAASIVLVAGTAQVMLMTGAWSPGTGLVAVLLASALMAASGRLHRRLQLRHRPPPIVMPPRPPATEADATRQDLPAQRKKDDEDDWLYQE